MGTRRWGREPRGPTPPRSPRAGTDEGKAASWPAPAAGRAAARGPWAPPLYGPGDGYAVREYATPGRWWRRATAAWGAVGCACLVTGGCGAAACWSWSEAPHCHVACLFFQWIFFVCSANGETKREKRDVLSRSDWTARMFRCCLRISNELGVRACRQEIDKPGNEDHSCLKRDVNVLYQY